MNLQVMSPLYCNTIRFTVIVYITVCHIPTNIVPSPLDVCVAISLLMCIAISDGSNALLVL